MVNALSALQNDIVIDSVYCWTDYQIALAWIHPINREFKTFVPNRVLSIRKNVDYPNWRYCKTEENLADIITRANKNFDENLWWYGLSFLRDKNSFYSYATTTQEDSALEEEIKNGEKKNIFVNIVLENYSIAKIIDVNKLSDVLKLFKLGTHWGFNCILTEDFKFWIKSSIILTWNSLKSQDTKMLWLILINFSWKFLKI